MDDNKLIQENEPKDLSFTAIYGSQFRDYQEKVQEGEEPAAKTLPSSISEEDMQALQRSKEQVLIGRTAKRKLEEEQQLMTIIATLLGYAAWETQRKMDEENVPSKRPKGFVGNSDVMQHVYAQVLQGADVFFQVEQVGAHDRCGNLIVVFFHDFVYFLTKIRLFS